MKNRNQFLGLLLVLLSLATSSAHAGPPEFTWKPGTVSAEVKFDKFRPEMGHYLYINHDENGAENWNMAKLNLPEFWKVKSVKVEGLIIHVTTQNAGEFNITPKNLKKFRAEILKAKNPTDEQLAELWRTHARAKKE